MLQRHVNDKEGDDEEGDGHNDEGHGQDEGHDNSSDPTTTTLHHEGEGDNRDNNDD